MVLSQNVQILQIYKYQFIIYTSVGYIGTTLFLLRTIVVNFLQERQLDKDEKIEYQLICRTSYLPKKILHENYTIIIAVQYLQFIYTCTSGACTDCFFFGLLLHLSAQFEILKNNWKTLSSEKTEKTSNGKIVVQVKMDKRLNEFIQRHQVLLILGHNLEISFNRVVLMQLLTSIVLICMSGKIFITLRT